jgi:hypothetical protein
MESQDDFRAALGAILSEARSVKRELSIFKLTPDIFDETIASKLKN